MNRYDMPIPRFLFGAAAAAMTAITIAVAVVLPAMVAPGSQDAPGVLAVGAPAVTDTEARTMRIDVVGECEPKTALDRVSVTPRREQRT